ncbi:MAG TPA: hypothetical protein VFV99_03945 [Kofleriaceae bacterium]|nr:hypothetical protein [Kofleriaceae bacterium]
MDARVGDTQTVDAQIDAKVFMDAKVYMDAPPDAAGVCNPLTQTGCNVGDKCTWLLDAVTPQYVGHIGCAPAGTANTGDACIYGAPGVTGYDGCKKGLVCGDYRGGAGVCKQICDNQGGSPACGANTSCVTYSGLFSTGSTTPAAAGVCDPSCDPLADNDFDGAGALTKTGTTCGSSATVGCYGYPSFGTPPITAWSCTSDINYLEAQPAGFRHRVQCTETSGCADPGPTLYVNSCNQGYLPLLRESTMVSTAVCVAMCKPHNCYLGSCGTNNDFRLGDAPHRCNTSDAMGTFDTSAGGEHCRFIWSFEIDDNNTFLRSPSSDTVGFCFDHSKYLYDSNNDGTADTPLPPCATLPNGTGSGTSFGAADLGCVDTANAGLPFTGKPHVANHLDLRLLFHPTRAP